MASYEFPSSSKNASVENTSTTSRVNSNDSNAPLTNGEAKKQIESVKKVLKDKAEKEKKETEKEKKEREKREKERKEKLDKIWNGVKGGFSKVTDNVSDVGEDVASDVTQEVFGSGLFATQMNNALSKALRGISESLKKITSFITTSIGKAWAWLKSVVKKFRSIFSRNGLFGTLSIYFRWMRMKLTAGFTKLWKVLESIKLFSFIGKLIGGVGSAIKGTISAGGDLVASLVKGILSGGVGAAVSAGLKSLGAALGGITAAALTSALVAGILAASGYAVSKTVDLVSNNIKANKVIDQFYEDGMYEYNGVKYQIPQEVIIGDGSPESLKQRDKRIVDWIKSKQEKADANDKERYERFIKEYPSVARDLGFDSPWWGQDKDKNGWKDYNSDRFNELRNAIKYGVRGEDNEWTKSLSASTKEELKNKSKLKNTAGVSST